MRQIAMITSATLCLLGPPVFAQQGLFIFPHQDLENLFGIQNELSFGTLLDPTPLSEPADSAQSSELLLSSLDPASPLHQLLASGQTSQAVAMAKQHLDQANQTNHSTQILERSLDLGIAFYADGSPQRALPLLKQGITALRGEQDWFNPRWLGPLLALGLAQQRLGQHEDADDSLARAQLLVQRHHGIYDPRQLSIVLSRAHSLEALDESFKTRQLYELHLKLTRRHSPADSAHRLASVQQLALWLVDQGQFKDAISVYHRWFEELAAIEGGADSPVQVLAMTQLSQIFLRQGGAEVDRGLTLAQQAATLVADNPDQFDASQIANTHLFAADWLTLYGKRKAAAEHYQQAWDAADPDLRRELAKPTMIFDGPDVQLSAMGYQWANRHAFANFTMTIRPDGRPARVKLTNTNMHATSIRLAQSMMRRARFRPALEDGQPIPYTSLMHNRIYHTEPFAGFGSVRVGGTALGGR